MSETIDPGHAQRRRNMSIAGGILFLLGALSLVVSLRRMFPRTSLVNEESSDSPMRKQALSFEEASAELQQDGARQFNRNAENTFSGFAGSAAGMLMVAGGIAFVQFAQRGRVARYVAGELVPVATDAFNEAAHKMSPGIREVASILKQEPASAEQVRVRCRGCGNLERESAKFCSGCGVVL